MIIELTVDEIREIIKCLETMDVDLGENHNDLINYLKSYLHDN